MEGRPATGLQKSSLRTTDDQIQGFKVRSLKNGAGSKKTLPKLVIEKELFY
jgi:hypothetical protein